MHVHLDTKSSTGRKSAHRILCFSGSSRNRWEGKISRVHAKHMSHESQPRELIDATSLPRKPTHRKTKTTSTLTSFPRKKGDPHQNTRHMISRRPKTPAMPPTLPGTPTYPPPPTCEIERIQQSVRSQPSRRGRWWTRRRREDVPR